MRDNSRDGYYRFIALILMNITPSLDIKGHEAVPVMDIKDELR